ncbi:LysR family transcriptional regulator [Companilactobacillus kimchii]|uniref:Transcription regulator n=2 Tax=Companilactobacillus kimchii TaxID=2801452 RepID=A0ABR5NX34_9LACO|nr:LysR family transcriptional regulator [Companilactobacillus kimchii]KAE9559931.1 LysR family transcriptional regulator [Companilactobacillus kimchii]KRK53445.1 transcription regulator [Companilactobacillus kimchii DSM 13961 = JCM 10707]OWF33472.1 putative HTH-type transcriptional regulator YhjC [Companilactobacillus kimchii]GEO46552.1 LysR family transcriptional regulator [Companilactobacillus paralimentarius]
MDTKKLAVFLDLAKTQNYSLTAQRMFLSQSTISKYIMILEKDWKVKLFVRAHRQIKLTRVGKLILPKVKDVLEKEAELNQLIASEAWLEERPLVIQGLPSLSQYRAFHIITDFAKLYPKVRLQFSEENVDKLEHSLDQKNVDIVFTRIFDNNFPSYDLIVNEMDRLVVLVPKNNHLADKDYITPDMLKRESLLLLSNTISISNPLYSAFQSLQLQPHVTYNGQRIDLILEMLNQGDGISIVMDKSFDLTGFENIRVVPLVPKINSQLVFMKQHDNTSKIVELFWNFAMTANHSFTNK